MDIRYDIHTLNNAEGAGKERKYVVLQQREPMTEEEMEKQIEENCSLTSSDVKAVFSEIKGMVVRQLSQGSRFCLPGIGWLSLSAGLAKAAQDPNHKITGKDIYLRGIQFREDKKLFTEIAHQVNFVNSKYSSLSVNYNADELWSKVSDYLSHNAFITRKIMRSEFGLSEYKANQWLKRFVEEGRLVKDGTKHMAIYLMGSV